MQLVLLALLLCAVLADPFAARSHSSAPCAACCAAANLPWVSTPRPDRSRYRRVVASSQFRMASDSADDGAGLIVLNEGVSSGIMARRAGLSATIMCRGRDPHIVESEFDSAALVRVSSGTIEERQFSVSRSAFQHVSSIVIACLRGLPEPTTPRSHDIYGLRTHVMVRVGDFMWDNSPPSGCVTVGERGDRVSDEEQARFQRCVDVIKQFVAA